MFFSESKRCPTGRKRITVCIHSTGHPHNSNLCCAATKADGDYITYPEKADFSLFLGTLGDLTTVSGGGGKM